MSDTLLELSRATEQGIAEGFAAAQALHAADKGGLALRDKATRTKREVHWHRPTFDRVALLHDPPEKGADTRAADGSFSYPAAPLFAVERCRRRREDGPARGRLSRPVVLDAIVGGSQYHLINFADKESLGMLHDCGLEGVPCGNPQCCGSNGRWFTSPVGWSSDTRSPFVLLAASGLPEPMAAVKQYCETCQKTSYHTDAVVLHRLLPVIGFLDSLPFDPRYQFKDVFLARPFTTSLE